MGVLRQCGPALRALLVLTVVTGLAYPLAVWAIGRTAFGDQADGSLVRRDGEVVGSTLIGQSFRGERWFHPRPSAAGDHGYDALASSGSNLGPTNPELVTAVRERRAAVAKANGVPVSEVPADAVTASASGLDPDISPAYAEIQIDRVARASGVGAHQVRRLVREHTAGRTLGFLGEPRVNVLELNLAVQRLA